MRKFETINSIAVPWLMPNVDTDCISPMKRLILNGDELDKYSFEPYRFIDGDGDKHILNMDFPLNHKKYEGAQILIVGENFGCGSSRETAPEAIRKCGYWSIIGSSFAGIFNKNCYQQGILPIVLPKEVVEDLAAQAEDLGEFTVNLQDCYVVAPNGTEYNFEIEDTRREQLLEGLDEVKKILNKSELYDSFLEKDKINRPWLY